MTTAFQAAPTCISRPANADLSAKQYRFMNVNSSGKLILATAGGRVVGVLQNDPDAADEPGSLQIAGVSMVMAGGSVTAGDAVASDANGEAVTASGADNIAGIALTTAADDEYCAVLLTGTAAVGLPAGIETVTTGALSLGAPVTHLSVTGTKAYSLADGEYEGQRKRVECTVAASIPAGTLTLNDAATGEPTTHVFNAVGQMIELMWTSTGWKLIAFREAGIDTPAAASTLNPLVAVHVIAIDGTDDWVLPDGEVPGQIQTFKVSQADNIPVGTISGKFNDEDGSADGTDINFDGVGDMAAVRWDGARWDPIQLVSATIS